MDLRIKNARQVNVWHLKLVPPAGLEPAQLYRPRDFTYHYSFHYQISLFVVWTMPLSLLTIRDIFPRLILDR